MVFGEQPSAAKFNILGTNDASFNDGTGIANLATNTTAISNPYKFSVYRNAAFSPGSPGKVTFDTEVFDTNNNFTGGTYTVPVTGFYWIYNSVGLTQVSGNPGLQAYIYKNGASVALGGSTLAVAGSWTYTCSVGAFLSLTAGDTIEGWVYASTLAGAPGATLTYMVGYLVSRT